MLLVLFVSTVAGGAIAGGRSTVSERSGLPPISLALTRDPTGFVGGRGSRDPVPRPRGVAAADDRRHRICASRRVRLGGVVSRARQASPDRTPGSPGARHSPSPVLNAAGLVLIQLDRLVIPHVLPLQDLATYGVLAAIAGSLFRVLQMGVGYTLVPRLRVAGSVMERRRLISHEAKLVGGLVVAGSAAIWLVTP